MLTRLVLSSPGKRKITFKMENKELNDNAKILGDMNKHARPILEK
jgi:hypothetical protein